MKISKNMAWRASEGRVGHAQGMWRRRETVIGAGGAALVAGGLLSGCINIAAPEAPIVIELNINIRQEVIYRLAADAANTIDENAHIF
jgi:hypothetical protein